MIKRRKRITKLNMNINKLIIVILIIFAFGFNVHSQKFRGKVETGYMKIQFNTIKDDPGPNWKGYNLNENGFDFNMVNGLKFNNKFYTGIGL
jgi:hypothetical protein